MALLDPANLGIGGPTSAAWREEALARVEGLRFLDDWIRRHPDAQGVRGSGDSIRRHLDAAQDVAVGAASRWRLQAGGRAAGPQFERALANLDTAETDLLRLAPDAVLEGALPSIHAHVNRFLAKDDPRREAVAGLARDASVRTDDGDGSAALPPAEAADRLLRPRQPLGPAQRELLLNALFAANTQRRRNLARVRSFRNMLRGGILASAILALALGLIGYLRPQAIPLCFAPESEGQATLVCPQATDPLGAVPLPASLDMGERVSAAVRPGDVALVEFLGLLGAALSVVALLRTLKGTSTPYNVPLLLAVLKVPIGALTAVAGLLLMRADFIPGLSALDSSAQILGWALIFGISQQLVTRLADDRADAIMEEVGGRGAAGDRPLPTRPGA